MENKSQNDWLEFIKNEIAEHNIVLFIRGTPQFPMCGFTARTVDLFKKTGKDFITHDMDSDPALWQALREMNDWQTSPQIFINGEFVGGCDNVFEMHESGELLELLSDS